VPVPPRVLDHLPLKPLVFQVLLALGDDARHGWSLVREIQERGEFGRLMPGNFYRTLRAMLAAGRSPTKTSDGGTFA
jgi:DNA-binding PadR family transcriptional regulator